MDRCGYQAAVRTNKPIGKLIRYFTKAEYNHTCIFLTNTLIFEASAKGTRISHISKYSACKILVVKHKNVEVNLEKIDPFVKRYDNRFYGYLQILGYLIAPFRKRKINPITDGLTCSEINHLYMQEVIGDANIDKFDKSTAVPQTLVEYWKNNPDYEIVEEFYNV